jgi:cytoskeleton protein RodZ
MGIVQGIGIGPALRRARLLRGKSVEEASRETRIRAEYLQALEGETFEVLLGDVYVRGFLRSYATYLGLDPGKVLGVYNRHFGGPRPTLPEASPGPIRSPRSAHPHLPQIVKHHPSWAFLIGVAVLLLAVFGTAGLLSRSGAGGGADAAEAPTASIPVEPPIVTLAIRALQPVQAVVRTDGRIAWSGLLRKGEARTFQANSLIELELNEGGLTSVTVNDRSMGKPGSPGTPYSRSFTPDSFRRTPSPSGN